MENNSRFSKAKNIRGSCAHFCIYSKTMWSALCKYCYQTHTLESIHSSVTKILPPLLPAWRINFRSYIYLLLVAQNAKNCKLLNAIFRNRKIFAYFSTIESQPSNLGNSALEQVSSYASWLIHWLTNSLFVAKS